MQGCPGLKGSAHPTRGPGKARARDRGHPALLTGAEAELVAGGGVGGAEGAVWLALWGSEEEMVRAEGLMREVSGEKGFKM